MKLILEKPLLPSSGGFNYWHIQPGDVEPTEWSNFNDYEGWINQYTEDGIWKNVTETFTGSIENEPEDAHVYELTNGGLPLGYMLAWLAEMGDDDD